MTNFAVSNLRQLPDTLKDRQPGLVPSHVAFCQKRVGSHRSGDHRRIGPMLRDLLTGTGPQFPI